jgi:hypothetical protein
MINLQKPLNTSTTMNKDLQAALEIDQMVNDRNYRWVVTQIWDEGNCCFPTVSTDRCLSCYAIMCIGEICDKYDCIYEIGFSVSKLEISIMDKLF